MRHPFGKLLLFLCTVDPNGHLQGAELTGNIPIKRKDQKTAAEQAHTILHSARQGSTGVRKEASGMI